MIVLWLFHADNEHDGQTDGRADTDASNEALIKVMNAVVVNRFRYIQPVWIACHWLAMSNCCYNPIVYCWMNDKFRYGFRYAFRWCPCVRCPEVPPTMLTSNDCSRFGGGRSTMYGGMRLGDAMRRTASDHARRTRAGSAAAVGACSSLCTAAVRRSTRRVETDVVTAADPQTPFVSGGPDTAQQQAEQPPTTCRGQRLRATRRELEYVDDSC